MKFKIEIKGSGKAVDIAKSLREIANGIDEAINSGKEDAILDGAEWEDETLMSEINAE